MSGGSFLSGMFSMGKASKSASGKAAPSSVQKKKKCAKVKPPCSTTAGDVSYSGRCIRRIEVAAPDAPASTEELPVCAVVVTLRAGSTYDGLFDAVPQQTDGGRVAVFGIDMTRISATALAHHMFAAAAEPADADADAAADGVSAPPPASVPASSSSTTTAPAATAGTPDVPPLEGGDIQLFEALRRDLAAVDPECTVFNFECCANCSSAGFMDGFSHVAQRGAPLFARRALDRGCMVMFSDFSLKAVIAEWDAALLGPNPFVEEQSGIERNMSLRFLPDDLKGCPSTQLAAVGELCSEGTAEVDAMPGTIRYNLAPGCAEGSAAGAETPEVGYTLKVLTRVTRCDNTRRTGLGHVSLTYPSGGVLLASCGHWIELQKLDTTFEALQRVVQEQEGAACMDAFACEYAAAPVAERSNMLRKKAAKCVQKSAPCKTKNSSLFSSS